MTLENGGYWGGPQIGRGAWLPAESVVGFNDLNARQLTYTGGPTMSSVGVIWPGGLAELLILLGG